MTDLVIIEAPGKLRTVRSGLTAAGVDARVVATIGHLRGYSRRLAPLGVSIDRRDGVVTEDRPLLRQNVRRFLAKEIALATRVVIATDGDHEGHVIADDMASMVAEVAPATPVLRMVPSGLDALSLARAYAQARPLDRTASLPGMARRIADRCFAARHSRPEEGRVVGRVQLGLLALCAQGRVFRRVMTAPLPAADGGRPFTVSVELPATVSNEQAQAWVTSAGPVVAGAATDGCRPPMDGADALLSLEADLGLTIADAARLLQEMYEGGRISYPRTSARAYTGMGAAAAETLSRVRGILQFQMDRVPLVTDEAHEALRLVGDESPDLMRPPRLAGRVVDGALTVIGRRMVESGLPMVRQAGVLTTAARAAPFEVHLERQVGGPRVAWSLSTPEAVRIRERSPEAALVAAMSRAGVGRPSTVARHATKLMASGWVDERLVLTDTGHEVLAAFPDATIAAAASPAFEAAIDAGGCVISRIDAALSSLQPTDEMAPEWLDSHVAPDQPESDMDDLEFEDDEDFPAYRLV